MEALDKLDKLILRSLQADGRATYEQIAEQVSLSPSAVLRRVKRLEESGVIGQYVALLNPKALGQHGTCFSIINLQTMSDGVLKGFFVVAVDIGRVKETELRLPADRDAPNRQSLQVGLGAFVLRQHEPREPAAGERRLEQCDELRRRLRARRGGHQLGEHDPPRGLTSGRCS